MQAVLQAAGGIKFNEKEARISGEAVTRSDKDATALADVFRFLAQIVQQNSGNVNNQQGAADLAALISKMQLSTESNVMKVSLAIPEEMLERVFRSPRARARTAVRAAVRYRSFVRAPVRQELDRSTLWVHVPANHETRN
jgi:class 3 adenylate cyclase